MRLRKTRIPSPEVPERQSKRKRTSKKSSDSKLSDDVVEKVDDTDQEQAKNQASDLFFISTEPSAHEPDDRESGDDDTEDNDQDRDNDEKPKEKSEDTKEVVEKSSGTNEDLERREKLLEGFLFGRELQYGASSKIEDIVAESESSDENDEAQKEDKKKQKKEKKRKAVWIDKDDEEIMVKDAAANFTKAKGKHGCKETSEENYAKSLKKKMISIVGMPKWADLDRKKQNAGSDDDSDDEFFRETTDLVERNRFKQLSRDTLEYRKLKDLNFQSHSEGSVIRAVEFHPRAAVSLVAGINGTASLFKVDGKLNPKIQSINFQDFPIKTAHFSLDGDEFIASSQHFPHFFAYDLHKGSYLKVRMPKKVTSNQGGLANFVPSPVGTGNLIAFMGRFGEIHFVNAKTKDVSFSFKMNEKALALAFSPDGGQIYSHGVGGEVYVWDVRSNRECLHKFVDDGCIKGTAIAVSSDNKFIATGSHSGVVNLYDRYTCMSSTLPKPEKSVLNLTTEIHEVKFNPTSEILAMSSEFKENAIKMMHVPSRTVFANFPSFNFNLKRVNSMDFSVNGGYFSVGNNRGAANLYRLKHFEKY